MCKLDTHEDSGHPRAIIPRLTAGSWACGQPAPVAYGEVWSAESDGFAVHRE